MYKKLILKEITPDFIIGAEKLSDFKKCELCYSACKKLIKDNGYITIAGIERVCQYYKYDIYGSDDMLIYQKGDTDYKTDRLGWIGVSNNFNDLFKMLSNAFEVDYCDSIFYVADGITLLHCKDNDMTFKGLEWQPIMFVNESAVLSNNHNNLYYGNIWELQTVKSTDTYRINSLLKDDLKWTDTKERKLFDICKYVFEQSVYARSRMA